MEGAGSSILRYNHDVVLTRLQKAENRFRNLANLKKGRDVTTSQVYSRDGIREPLTIAWPECVLDILLALPRAIFFGITQGQDVVRP
jgi:hypothetical protein